MNPLDESSPHSSSPVVVTGASGFIGLHVVRQLLEKGYRVRGTLRSPEREAGLRAALAGIAGLGERLELVQADLQRDEGWEAAFEGSEFVLHVASPVPERPPAHDDEPVVPARDGTLRVLRAAHSQGVSRVLSRNSSR